jgi:hypothetical protein
MIKKIAVLSLLLCSVQLVQAQEGIRLGVKGSYMSTWLFNNNISDAGDYLNYAPAYSGAFGVQAIYMFSDAYGISVDLNYAGQNSKYEDSESQEYLTELKLRYIDLPVLFRASSEKGPYFEIGPQFSFLAGAKESYTDKVDASNSYSDKDFKDNFAGFGLSAVLGFGVDIKLTEMINLTTGLRFGYQFTDATNEYTLDEAGAALANDQLSSVALASHFVEANPLKAFDYTKSNRVFGGLQLGLQFNLAK